MYFVILITVYLPKLKFKVSRLNFYGHHWVAVHFGKSPMAVIVQRTMEKSCFGVKIRDALGNLKL